MLKKRKKSFRSQQWFNNPKNPDMTALYLERYLNYGLTRKELQSGNPCLLYTSPSPRDVEESRMPSSA